MTQPDAIVITGIGLATSLGTSAEQTWQGLLAGRGGQAAPMPALESATPDGKGGFIAPTGKAWAIDVVTVGIWNRQGTMDEEFLFWDNQSFFAKLGLA